VTALDPTTGEEIWTVASVASRSSNAIAFDEAMVFSSSTYPSNELLAIHADGTGDVTDTKVAWSAKRGCADVPSPLVYNGLLFLLADNGVLTVYDTNDGSVRKRKRLPGNYSASPCVAAARLYLVSEEGTLSVLSADAETVELLEVRLPAGSLTNPVFAEERIVLRTMNALISVHGAQHENPSREFDR